MNRTNDDRATPAGCCLCGMPVEALVETAHVPDRKTAPDETARLCVLCHRAYDLGLMKTEEILTARNAWLQGKGPLYTHNELVAIWFQRPVDWSLLHKGAQKKGGRKLANRARARRAAETRRARLADAVITPEAEDS